MKHVLILRALGFVLVIALAVNLTAVLAAPLYLDSSDQLAEAEPTDDHEPLPSDDPAEDDNTETPGLIVIDADILQSDPTIEPDFTNPEQTVPVQDEAARERLAAKLREGSERIFFGLGARIGARSHRQPVASAIRRFLRRRLATDPTDTDLIPTVVITGSDDLEPNETGVPPTEIGPPPGIERVVLENPIENGYAVSFQLGGTVQTLKPGAVLIETSNQSVIRFDQGGTFGEFRQELVPGHYKFRVSQEGWKLEKAKEDAASL